MAMAALEIELDLDFLTVEERQTILAVLQRDEELRQAEQERKRVLKGEITALRQQSAVRVGSRQKNRQCVRCQEELGLFFQRGEICIKCKHRICMNCRVSVMESASLSWLCTLCSKQRLLPAVAGDWFYAKIEESQRYSLHALHGSDVVRSSIRRTRPHDAAGKGRTQSVPELRNNPFSDTSASVAADRTTPMSPPGNGKSPKTRRTLSNVEETEGFVHAPATRIVRAVRSGGMRGSSSSETSSSDEESDRGIQNQVLAELQSSSSRAEELVALATSGLSFPDVSEKNPSTATIGSSSLMSRSAEGVSSVSITSSLDPYSPGTDRQRSQSAAENVRFGEDDCESGREQLTSIEFRRCSGVSSGDMKQLDDGTCQAADSWLGSGGSSNVGAGGVVGSVANSNPSSTNTAVELTHSVSCESAASDDSSRRKLRLTPDLETESPMIGRRELDISKKFLKSFSDSSSSDDDTLDDDDDDEMFDQEELNRYDLDMPRMERPQLRPKLSAIAEEDSPNDTSQQTTESKERNKLKLIIHPEKFALPTENKVNDNSQETPVTPGKYSSNWDDFAAAQKDVLTKSSSWSSGAQSAEVADNKANLPGMATIDMNPSSPLVSGGFDVIGLGVSGSSRTERQQYSSGLSYTKVEDGDRLELFSEATSGQGQVQPHRRSPDGASPLSSNEEGAVDYEPERKLSEVPQVAISSPVDEDPSYDEYEDERCHSIDDLDEEDIDNLVAEVKKAHKTSKLSSSLTVSMESITSVMSEAGADYTKHEITGDIQISLDYNMKMCVLTLTIHKCRDIAAINKKKQTSDPYVKAYIISGTQRFTKRKTKVKKGTVSPVYDETFRYTITLNDLATKTLQISVWSFQRIGQGEFLGEVKIPFSTYSFEDHSGHAQWMPLCSRVPKTPDSAAPAPSQLRVALRSSPIQATRGKGARVELQVKVICARDLPTKKSGMHDPYVKCVLMPEKIKQKTSVMRNNLNPVWDETFTYSKASIAELEESSLNISVVDHDRFSSNDLIGTTGLNLGRQPSSGKQADWINASGAGKLLWQTMINNPGDWVDQWLTLDLV